MSLLISFSTPVEVTLVELGGDGSVTDMTKSPRPMACAGVSYSVSQSMYALWVIAA